VVDSAGNLYFADSGNGRIRIVSTDGVIATVAGSGNLDGSSLRVGDNGPGSAASVGLNSPQGVALDSEGNLYVADAARVRRVAPDGTITTIAGNGIAAYSGDGGPATSAWLSFASGVAVDLAGNF
jgi:sugar lactone lactonase YvrE